MVTWRNNGDEESGDTMATKKVVILGAGISGLTAAWSLARASSKLNIVLLEGSGRVGGWIRSERRENGTVHDLGPHSMRVAQKAGKLALAFVSELGLEPEVLPIASNNQAFNTRYVYTDQHGLVALPSRLTHLLATRPPFSSPLLACLIREALARPYDKEDESVQDFFTSRLGPEVADWLVDPMCRGIYAGDSAQLSIRSSFSWLHRLTKQHGSLVRAAILAKPEKSGVEKNPLVQRAMKEKWTAFGFQRGLQTLVETLGISVESMGVEVRLDSPVTGVDFEEGSAKVTCNDAVYHADYVISALPSLVLGKVLANGYRDLSYELWSIPSVDVGVVNLEYDGHVIPEKWREAFGYLVPSHQKSDILGVIFDSSAFHELNNHSAASTRLTVMLGGHAFPELFGNPDTVEKSTVTQTALKALGNHLGITQDPREAITNINKNCISQYIVGHDKRLDTINNYISTKRLPLSLLGSSYKGVSVNDCIVNSLDEANNVINHLHLQDN